VTLPGVVLGSVAPAIAPAASAGLCLFEGADCDRIVSLGQHHDGVVPKSVTMDILFEEVHP